MANTQLTQTGAQVQADLNLLDSNSATSGQVLTADGSGGCAWATPSGGSGADISTTTATIPLSGSWTSNGHTVTLNVLDSNAHVDLHVFGLYDGVFGWHDFFIYDPNDPVVITKAVFMLFEDWSSPGGPYISITNNNNLMFADGSAVSSTYNSSISDLKKLICVLGDATFDMRDND